MRRRYIFPTFVAIAALTLTGCVDNSAKSAGAPAPAAESEAITTDDAVAALVPEKTAKSGVLVIATSPNYPPNEFKDEAGQPIGWGIEVAGGIAAKLGLKPSYKIASFENIIPGITNGTLDLGESSFTDNPERQKQIDFVNYYNSGTQWASAKGKTVDPTNACGLTVAVQATTKQDVVDLPSLSEKCVASGKEPITKLPFDTQDSAINAVVLGTADAVTGAAPVILYGIEKTGDKLQTAGEMTDTSFYGLGVAKNSAMVPAVQAALQSMIDDGSYQEILDRWGVAAGAVTKATINAGA